MVPQLGTLAPGEARSGLMAAPVVRHGFGSIGWSNGSLGQFNDPAGSRSSGFKAGNDCDASKLDFRVPGGAIEGFVDAMSTGSTWSMNCCMPPCTDHDPMPQTCDPKRRPLRTSISRWRKCLQTRCTESPFNPNDWCWQEIDSLESLEIAREDPTLDGGCAVHARPLHQSEVIAFLNNMNRLAKMKFAQRRRTCGRA